MLCGDVIQHVEKIVMIGPLGNSWNYGWYYGWVRCFNEGWTGTFTWVWDIVSTNTGWAGWALDWYYGWGLDWYYGWTLSATTSWEFGWNLGWFTWGGSWFYGWNQGWFQQSTWGWVIDWAYGWTVDWFYGWHYHNNIGWGVEYGWVMQTQWTYAEFYASDTDPAFLEPWTFSWLSAATDYGWFVGYFAFETEDLSAAGYQ